VKEKLLQLFIEYRRSYIDNELEVVDLWFMLTFW
jgi:hypothetical protein